MDYSISACKYGSIFTITRPDSLNSITLSVLGGLSSCIDALEKQGKRYLVLTAEGARAFSAGTHLNEVLPYSAEAAANRADLARSVLVRLLRSPLISICAINGLAFGGGLEFAMACTFRLAVRHATLSLPEVRLGLLPSYGGTQFLPALVGRARALDLMLTGRTVDAAEACQIGLVHRVIDNPDDLLSEALKLAHTLSHFSPHAVSAIRECINVAGDQVTNAGLAVEGQAVRAVAATPEAEEGILAFVEKRPPVVPNRRPQD